jgi:Proteasome-substrate-size regulator, mid region
MLQTPAGAINHRVLRLLICTRFAPLPVLTLNGCCISRCTPRNVSFHVLPCSWSTTLARFLHSMYLNSTKRLTAESTDYWRGDVTRVKICQADFQPVFDIVFDLASKALFHKNATMRGSALHIVVGLGYLLPQKVLPFALNTVLESLDSTDAVHRLSGAVRLLAGANRHTCPATFRFNLL